MYSKALNISVIVSNIINYICFITIFGAEDKIFTFIITVFTLGKRAFIRSIWYKVIHNFWPHRLLLCFIVIVIILRDQIEIHGLLFHRYTKPITKRCYRQCTQSIFVCACLCVVVDLVVKIPEPRCEWTMKVHYKYQKA